MEALDLSGYDLVLSSSSAWAHGVLPSENAVHVCYCHNPFRYAWNAREATLCARGPVMRAALGIVLQRWRQWDWIAAQRVDRYIANSETTRRRIARYFTRDAEVVHPPVEIGRFAPGTVGDHYAVLSELMPHKRIELAVRAFNQLRRPLVVIGDGPDARRLQRLAGPTIRFTGRVSDVEVARLLASSRALIVTATEEFGIAAVEAQAAGRPVIALDEGGVTESVQEGRTGVFYEQATPEALAAAVAAFDPLSVDPAACVANAQRFGRDAFAQEIRANVEHALAVGPSPRGDRRRSARGLALAGRRAA
jgi:glycosyltransferase involved in cell wall biosynthesis